MTDKEHRMMQALYRAELVLLRARRAAAGTDDEDYVQAATADALQILAEDSAETVKQYKQHKGESHA